MTDYADIYNALAGSMGKEFIKTEPDTLIEYAVDNTTPKAVIFPKNTHEVSEVVKYANRENLAVVPWGSGSKMAMGNPPKRLDLVVCTSRMNHMMDIDTANLTITVEAGVKFRDLQARLAPEEDRCYLPLEDPVTEANDSLRSETAQGGCFLPIDATFSRSATMGGVVACNSSGPRRLLYGLPRDMVLGARFVAPTGEIVGTGGKTAKNVSGYDISKLMIGSLGTLGILCEMTFRLLPLPERMETLLVSFDSLPDLQAFVNRVFETQLLPAAVEVMNSSTLSNLKMDGVPGFGIGDYVTAVALEAFEPAVNRMRVEMLDMAKAAGAKDDKRMQEDQHRHFWLAVSNLFPSPAEKSSSLITVQLNYPICQWKEILEFAEDTLSTNTNQHTILAHAGNGLCQISLLIDQGDTAAVGKAIEAIGALLEGCRKAGGNLVVQRAPAELKGQLPMWGEMRSDFPLMKRIRKQTDPKGIMSPGRFVGGL
jgi:glycolate oxidase FAD binding subunit